MVQGSNTAGAAQTRVSVTPCTALLQRTKQDRRGVERRWQNATKRKQQHSSSSKCKIEPKTTTQRQQQQHHHQQQQPVVLVERACFDLTKRAAVQYLHVSTRSDTIPYTTPTLTISLLPCFLCLAQYLGRNRGSPQHASNVQLPNSHAFTGPEIWRRKRTSEQPANQRAPRTGRQVWGQGGEGQAQGRRGGAERGLKQPGRQHSRRGNFSQESGDTRGYHHQTRRTTTSVHFSHSSLVTGCAYSVFNFGPQPLTTLEQDD